jgi:hypothetical protein
MTPATLAAVCCAGSKLVADPTPINLANAGDRRDKGDVEFGAGIAFEKAWFHTASPGVRPRHMLAPAPLFDHMGYGI